jgi:hypothetical protein
MLGRMRTGLYNMTVGRLWGTSEPEELEPTEDKEYICLGFLDRQADILTRWAFKNDQQLMTLSEVEKRLRNSTEHSFEDIQLLVKHMIHSGKLDTA